MPGDAAGTYESGRQRRELILAAAFDHFAQAGYHGASLREIAAAAGVTHPGLRHHFPTKEALLEAVLQQREQRAASALSQVEDDHASAVERLAALLERNAAEPGLVQLFTRLSVEAADAGHAAHEYFTARYERIRRYVEHWLLIDQAEGRVPGDLDCWKASIALVALSDGLQIQWLLAPDAITMSDALRDGAQSVLIRHATLSSSPA